LTYSGKAFLNISTFPPLLLLMLPLIKS